MDLFECLVFRAMTDTFTDNKFDATKVVGSAPVALTEKLSLENGESETKLNSTVQRHFIQVTINCLYGPFTKPKKRLPHCPYN